MQADHLQSDKVRDEYLKGLGYKILRFNSKDVLRETDAIVDVIFRTMQEQHK